MKNYLIGLLLMLVAFSCTTKKENETQVADNGYIAKPVGVINNGNYDVIEVEENSKKWEASIRESFGLTDTIPFSKFEIVKTTTLGDASEDCYLLLTHTSDGSSVGIILLLNDGKFYFDVIKRGKKTVATAIICKSSGAGSGCMPSVIMHNKHKQLMCSANDCEKTIGEILF